MTIDPKLKKELFELLEYNPETGKFSWLRSWVSGNGVEINVGQEAGHKCGLYQAVSLLGKDYLLHRLAFVFMTGDWPKHTVDHINRNRKDNRWCNLRDVTHSRNLYNIGHRPDNTSGRKGVYWFERTGKWMASIGYDGLQRHLGYFKTFEEAVAAREAAEEKYYASKR